MEREVASRLRRTPHPKVSAFLRGLGIDHTTLLEKVGFPTEAEGLARSDRES